MDSKNTIRDRLLGALTESGRGSGGLRSQIDCIAGITTGIIYLLDPDGKFVFVNKAVEEMLHYDPDELIGKHFSVILPPLEYLRVGRRAVLPRITGTSTGSAHAPKLFDERRTGQRKTKNLEVQLISKSQRHVRLATGDVTGIIAVEGVYDRGPAHGGSGRAAGFVGSQGLIVDITGYKKAQRERLGVHHRLLELQKMDAVGRLAEGIGHDFNNKLGTIIGCAEMIKENYAQRSPEINACIEPILSASRHAADLAAKLLEFGRRGPTAEEDVRVHALIDDMVTLLEHTIDKRIAIRRSLCAEPPVVRGDAGQIQSALLNIVMNACDAMRHGGALVLATAVHDNDAAFRQAHPSAKGADRYARVSVIDNGEGMDGETKARMFEPFFTTKAECSSLGMGLNGVVKMVRTHKGFIEVESDPGKGTRVDLFIPLAGVEPQSVRGLAANGRILRGAGRILAVDDEIEFLGVLKHMLEDLGYSVVAVSSDREAVAYYRKHSSSVDCVVIDVMMPELSGRECFREMKKINPSVKAVVSTGYGLNPEVEAFLKDGARDYIHKPFDNAKLSQVLAKVMQLSAER